MNLLGGSMETIKITIDENLPNKETIEAIEEGRRLAKDPKVKKYNNMKDLIEALES